jgi:hypothetical protein
MPESSLAGSLIFGLVIDGAGTVNLSLDSSAFAAGHDVAMLTTPVPEPSVLLQALAGLCVAGLVVARRRSRC